MHSDLKHFLFLMIRMNLRSRVKQIIYTLIDMKFFIYCVNILLFLVKATDTKFIFIMQQVIFTGLTNLTNNRYIKDFYNPLRNLPFIFKIFIFNIVKENDNYSLKK